MKGRIILASGAECLQPEAEFDALASRYPGTPRIVQVAVDYTNSRFFRSRQAAYKSERRGEVVFAVERPSGMLVVTRMKEYPKGIFRLPSGGVSYGEGVVSALDREIREELGVLTVVKAFLGIIRYQLRHGSETADFSSYVFYLKEVGGRIMHDAQDDEISEFREVSPEGLRAVASSLRSISDAWRDWGMFRAIAADFVADCLAGHEAPA